MKKLFTQSLVRLKSQEFIHVIIVTMVVVMLISVTGSRLQAQTDNSTGVKVWAVPGEQKVRPDDKAETSNLVWSAEKKQVTIAGAGNEHVPFQVVISTPVPPGWRPKAPDGFFVRASELKSAQGKVIPQQNVKLFTNTKKKSIPFQVL